MKFFNLFLPLLCGVCLVIASVSYGRLLSEEHNSQTAELRVCETDKATLLAERAARAKEQAEQRKKQAARVASADTYFADGAWVERTICAAHRYAWTTRIEGAAGMSPGSLKPLMEKQDVKSLPAAQRKILLKALTEYPYPECDEGERK